LEEYFVNNEKRKNLRKSQIAYEIESFIMAFKRLINFINVFVQNNYYLINLNELIAGRRFTISI
jgi:hypothetical protein